MSIELVQNRILAFALGSLLVASVGFRCDAAEAPAARTVAGRVVSASGQPITGVSLKIFTLEEHGEKLSAETQSAEAGRFSAHRLPTDRPLLIVAEREGLAPACARLDAAQTEAPVLTLSSGLSTSVCLKDRVSDRAVAGVAVALDPVSKDLAACLRSAERVPSGVTDHHGTVSWGNLPGGSYRILVTDERYLELPETLVDAAESGDGAKPCVSVRRAAAITGRLIDSDGKALHSTEIALYGAGSSEGPLTLFTSDGKTGEFRFPRLDPASSYHVVVRGRDCLERARRETRAGGPEVVVQQPAGQPLAVRVVDAASDSPLISFDLMLAPPGFPSDRASSPAEMGCLFRARPEDASGAVRLRGLMPGKHVLAVVSPGYQTETAPVIVTSETPAPVVVRMKREICRSVRLQDSESDSPIDGALIATEAEIFEDLNARAMAPPIRSDSAGRFRFCPSYPGDRDFFVHHEGYAPKRVEVGSLQGDEDLVVALDRGGIVTGEVWDRHGQAESGVEISAHLLGQTFDTVTDGAGRYRIEHAPPGTISLTRAASSGGGALTRPVRVENGKTASLNFGSTSETTLRILDGDSPVKGARVILRSGTQTGGETARATTDEDGRLHFERSEGLDAMAAVDQGSLWVFSRIPSSKDKETMIRLPARRFSGRLLASDRTPLGNALVIAQTEGTLRQESSAQPDDPEIWSTSEGSESKTDPRGSFELRVPAGTSGLTIFLPGGRVRRADLPEGESGEIVLELLGRIRGHVSGFDEAPHVALIPAGTRYFSVTKSATPAGDFDLSDLEESQITLVVSAAGMAPYLEPGLLPRAGQDIEREIRLSAGARLEIVFRSSGGGDAAAQPGFLTTSDADLGWLLQQVAPPQQGSSGNGLPTLVYPHVPAGVHRIRCGEGAKTVRVEEGGKSVVECP